MSQDGYPKCGKMGYFPSSQGAIKVPASARDVTLRSPKLFSPSKQLELESNQKKIYLYPWHFYAEHAKEDDNGKWTLNYDKKKKETFHDSDKFIYDSPPPRQSPERFIDEEFSSFIRPQDKTWNERDSDGMPEWMWDMLRIDDENAGTDRRSPKKMTQAQIL